MINFDMSATTQPYDEVIQAMADVLRNIYGNPSSIHRLGAEAERLVAKARETAAALLRVKPQEIVFTSGGTESNNLAIKGAARANRMRGGHIITTMVEHSSVYESCRQLEQEGFRITWLPVDGTGAVQLSALERAITEETILVSVMHVNNEVGTIQPIEQMGELLRRYPKILFHVDAVQSVGKLEIRPAEWGVDLMSLSAHKICGPKGVGILYRREGVRLSPLFSGGSQEHGDRPGTENVPGIVGGVKALRMALEELPRKRAHMERLREVIVRGVRGIPALRLNGSEDSDAMAPHIVSFSIPGVKPEVFVHSMEQHGICVSSRSACSSKENRPSRVLAAMGVGDERARSGIRVSYTADHTLEQAEALCVALAGVTAQLAAGGEGRS